MRTTDARKLTELCEGGFYAAVGTGISEICKSTIEELKRIPSSLDPSKADFKALRLNWFRIEASLSSIQNTVQLTKFKDVADRFNLIYQHSRFVDDLDSIFESYLTLKDLWYQKEAFSEVPYLPPLNSPSLSIYRPLLEL
jgi:hypothetical protein